MFMSLLFPVNAHRGMCMIADCISRETKPLTIAHLPWLSNILTALQYGRVWCIIQRFHLYLSLRFVSTFWKKEFPSWRITWSLIHTFHLLVALLKYAISIQFLEIIFNANVKVILGLWYLNVKIALWWSAMQFIGV